jgi:hypothetical protein
MPTSAAFCIAIRIVPERFPSRELFTQKREICIGYPLFPSFASVRKIRATSRASYGLNALTNYLMIIFMLCKFFEQKRTKVTKWEFR